MKFKKEYISFLKNYRITITVCLCNFIFRALPELQINSVNELKIVKTTFGKWAITETIFKE